MMAVRHLPIEVIQSSTFAAAFAAALGGDSIGRIR
jgi:hypothetical protein